MSLTLFVMINFDWWIIMWMYILMNYYVKVCIYVDELLCEWICWINMMNYMMLQLNDEYLWDYNVEVVIVVDVVIVVVVDVVKSFKLYVDVV